MSDKRPQMIQFFLPQGEPRGIRRECRSVRPSALRAPFPALDGATRARRMTTKTDPGNGER